MLRNSAGDKQTNTDSDVLKLAELKDAQAKCDQSLTVAHKAVSSYVACYSSKLLFGDRRCSSLAKKVDDAGSEAQRLAGERDRLFGDFFPAGSSSQHEAEATKAKYYNCRQGLAIEKMGLVPGSFSFLRSRQEGVYKSALEMQAIKCEALKDRAEMLERQNQTAMKSGR